MTTNKYSGTKTNTNLVFQSTRAFDDERRKRRPERARREEPTPGAERRVHVETQIVSVLKRTGDELLQRRIQRVAVAAEHKGEKSTNLENGGEKRKQHDVECAPRVENVFHSP